MSNNITSNFGIPEGRRDYIFSDASLKREICQKLVKLFSDNGYEEVITPTSEFYKTFTNDQTQLVNTEIYKFSDEKNRLMALRCDCTVPIARVAATKLTGNPQPYRIFYNQNVFSASTSQYSLNEYTQCGAELIGTDLNDTLQSDIEILELAAKSMETFFGLDFNIEIGHGKLFKTLVEIYNLDAKTAENIRILIEKKNFTAIESLKIPQPFKLLPKMFGHANDDGDIAALDFFADETNDARIREIIDYIKLIIFELRKKGYGDCLSFDLGLVGRLDYYTGIIFGGFIRGLGRTVLLGGRYDNLTANFGRMLAATGFGITADIIFDVLKSKDVHKKEINVNKQLRIALTKGRLEQKTIELFEKNGVDCSALKNKGRKLLIPLCDGKIEVMLVKSFDVITYVEHGVCDLGIVGRDTITEFGSSLYEILDLGFGKCRMVLAAKKAFKDNPEAFFNGYSKKILATKFEKTARQYVSEKGHDAEIIKIEGSVELAPILNLSDGIIDIVETGTTLHENGLEIVEEIFDVSARVVANVAAMKLRKKEIDEIITSILK